MGTGFKRSARVKDLIQQEISRMIVTGEIKDPRISDVAITGIYLSDDLGYARLYFVPLIKESDINEINKGFESSSGYIRKKLAQKLSMKKTPKLVFEHDSTLENSYRIDEIIKGVSSE